MDKERKGFTIIWQIKNFSFYWQVKGKGFTSRSFLVDTIGETQWSVGMLVGPSGFEKCLGFYLIRGTEDKGFEKLPLEFELSILSCDGTSLVSKHICKNIFVSDEWSSPLVLKQDDLKQKRDVFLPDDVLTIRCRMWKNECSVSEDGRCFAVTRFPVTEVSFVGIVEKFSDLRPAVSKAIRIRTASIKKKLFSMNISKDCNGNIYVEITPVVTDHPSPPSVCKCKLFIVDTVGNKLKCGKDEFLFSFENATQSWKFPLSVTNGKLMDSQTKYLPNNSLSLQCEFAFTTGLVYQEIEKTEYSATLFTDAHSAILDFEDVNNSTKEFESSLIWKNLLSFCRTGVLCDTKLYVGSKSFTVHSLILSIRSPVFSEMLSRNKTEMALADFQIEDLDEDTTQRMLTFMYSETSDNLNWERAKKLYFAASRYDIVSLKCRCSTFLRDNLLPSNICDALLLADQYQDNDLKKAAQSYISAHDRVIIHSDQWKNLEKKYPVLMLETFRIIYLKKCQK